MLPSAPPHYSSWAELVAPIEEGETGWRPYALQHALKSVGRTIVPDGDFGADTARIVRAFQEKNGLYVDGIAGPATQGLLLAKLGNRTHVQLPDVPDGLMRGFAVGEGAGVLAATNWSVPGGVDCGAMQWRVYGPPYDQGVLRSRFETLPSMLATGQAFLERYARFRLGAWCARQGTRREEWAKRCAVLAHNWPAGADTWARTGTVSSPDSPATWAPPGARFPNGALVITRRDWAQFYAMGGPHGEGVICRHITAW
jgi:hypothetical protein